jgi:hypothetical protein
MRSLMVPGWRRHGQEAPVVIFVRGPHGDGECRVSASELFDYLITLLLYINSVRVSYSCYSCLLSLQTRTVQVTIVEAKNRSRQH